MEHRDAIGEVYGGSFRRLVVQLYAVTGDLGEAQEVVQEAFVRALAAPRGFAELDNPEAWLRRVAINLARTRWRRRRVLDRLLHRVAPDPVVADPSPEHIVLMDALRELPDGQRHALALHYLSDLPIDEVARTLDVSIGTVKSRLHRGRVALAALLADEPNLADQTIKQPTLAELAGRAQRRVRKRRAMAATAAVVAVAAALTAVQFLNHPPVRPPVVSPTVTPSPVPTTFIPSSQTGEVTVFDSSNAVRVDHSCMISVLVTTNGGASWSNYRRPVQAIDCLGEPDATFEVLSPSAYLATSLGTTYFTGDSGKTWTRWQPHVSLRPGLPDDLHPRGCDYCETTYFEAVDSAGLVFRSSSQPPLRSWSLTRGTPDGSFWLLGTGPVGGVGVATTADRGRTWKSGVLPTGLRNAAIGPVDARVAYVVGERADQEFLYRTRDGGLTWTEIKAPQLDELVVTGSPPLIVANDAGRLVVGAVRTGFWISESGGETFAARSDFPSNDGLGGTSRDGQLLWALGGSAIVDVTVPFG